VTTDGLGRGGVDDALVPYAVQFVPAVGGVPRWLEVAATPGAADRVRPRATRPAPPGASAAPARRSVAPAPAWPN
jgi:hypothetical protein